MIIPDPILIPVGITLALMILIIYDNYDQEK